MNSPFLAAETRLPPLALRALRRTSDHAQHTGGAVAALSTVILAVKPAAARSLGTALELAWSCYTTLACTHAVTASRCRWRTWRASMSRWRMSCAGKKPRRFTNSWRLKPVVPKPLLRESLERSRRGDRRALLPLRIQARIALATLLPGRGDKVIRCCSKRPTRAAAPALDRLAH